MEKNALTKIDKALLSLESLSPQDIESMLETLFREERRLSQKRRELHRKIDEARREILERLKNQKRKAGKEILENLVNSLLNPVAGLPDDLLNAKELEVELDTDIKSLSFEELENYYNTLRKEESIVSFKRRWIQGKIDLLKNWLNLKQSIETGLNDEEFARLLTKFLSEKGF